MKDRLKPKDPQSEPTRWPGQDVIDPFDPTAGEAPDDGQPLDPDATHQDLPLARRLARAS